jgi:hypothetical protein
LDLWLRYAIRAGLLRLRQRRRSCWLLCCWLLFGRASSGSQLSANALNLLH